jgi:hypothetical protein
MASGLVCRANRPNTWLHRPASKREEKPCQLRAVHTWHFCDIATSRMDVRFRGRAVVQRTSPARPSLTDGVEKVSAVAPRGRRILAISLA